MTITQEQARAVALAIYQDIAPYIQEHWAEYQTWRKEHGYPCEETNSGQQNAAVYIALAIHAAMGGGRSVSVIYPNIIIIFFI